MFISWTQSTLCLGILLNSKWQRIWNLGKSSAPGKLSRCRVVPGGTQWDSWQRIHRPSHHAQNQHWEDKVNTRCWMGCKPPHPNSQLLNSLLEAELPTPIPSNFMFWFIVSHWDLQLQQAAVSALAACPPPWDKHTMAGVTSGWAGQTLC